MPSDADTRKPSCNCGPNARYRILEDKGHIRSEPDDLGRLQKNIWRGLSVGYCVATHDAFEKRENRQAFKQHLA